ncbi:MAG TPA: hydrolase, partial [Agriterribacter sp.]|nr:hydrolase [Agriterribacter sp.]
FTMGIEDAIQAASFVQCNQIIGVHYDTFGYIKIDHEKAQRAFSGKGLKLHLFQPGQTLDI